METQVGRAEDMERRTTSKPDGTHFEYEDSRKKATCCTYSLERCPTRANRFGNHSFIKRKVDD
jgi:hypothetical protein